MADAPAPDPRSSHAVVYVFRETADPREFLVSFDLNGEEAVAVALPENGFSCISVSPGVIGSRFAGPTWP